MNRATENIRQQTQRKKREQREAKYELRLPEDLDRPISPDFLGPFAVTPAEIEQAGYAVVSQRYLARLEFIAAASHAFLDSKMDRDAFAEELRRS